MIPKIIHHIWIGPNSLPEKEKLWIQSWKNFHPDFEFCLWTNENLPELSPRLVEVTKSLKHKYALVCDIYRYEILSKYGGFYLDTDIECYKRKLDEFLELDFVGIEPRKNAGYITNAFFGCSKPHKAPTLALETVRPLDEKQLKHGYCFTSGMLLTKSLIASIKKDLRDMNVLSDKTLILDSSSWGDKRFFENSFMKHYFKASHIDDRQE